MQYIVLSSKSGNGYENPFMEVEGFANTKESAIDKFVQSAKQYGFDEYDVPDYETEQDEQELFVIEENEVTYAYIKNWELVRQDFANDTTVIVSIKRI